MSSRRQFIRQGVGAFAGSLAIDSIFGRAARAASAVTAPGSGGPRTLVVVNLQGGNDGLNTLLPYGDPAYYRVRPTINIPQGEVLRIDSYVRPFHLASALDYVASGAYRREPSFQRYLQARGERLRGRGENVELWK